MSDRSASVIILGWGGESYIRTCLDALRRQTYPASEVIVVDNASPDRTAEIVANEYPEVNVIRTGRNLGVAGGNNVGLRAAQGDLRVLINADVEVSPDWLGHLVHAVESDATIGIAGAKLLYPDGTIQFAGGRIDGPQGYTYHLGWHEPDRGQWDTGGDVDFVTGASLAITRQALDRIGYEDEKFFPIDYEDPDMSYRARAAGLRVVLVPQAVAVHHESSTAHANSLMRTLALQAGRVRFVSKHWPAARLREEFFPAECDFVRGASSLNRHIMRWVYLKTLREVDNLADWRAELGVGELSESRAVLTEMLSRLRDACLPGTAGPSSEGVAPILEAWFASGNEAADRGSNNLALFLALSRVDGYIEPHVPIAWPHWPPGVRPKIVAFFQKLTRRLVSWYINPMVEKQNAVNAALLHAVEVLAQEVAVLEERLAARDGDAAVPPDHGVGS